MPELQRQALLQIARADADRIEVLHHVQHVLDVRRSSSPPIAAISSTDAIR